MDCFVASLLAMTASLCMIAIVVSSGEHSMSIELYLAYVLACIVVAVVPGPMVALVIANSLRHGTRAGLLNVAGAESALGRQREAIASAQQAMAMSHAVSGAEHHDTMLATMMCIK